MRFIFWSLSLAFKSNACISSRARASKDLCNSRCWCHYCFAKRGARINKNWKYLVVTLNYLPTYLEFFINIHFVPFLTPVLSRAMPFGLSRLEHKKVQYFIHCPIACDCTHYLQFRLNSISEHLVCADVRLPFLLTLKCNITYIYFTV